jgi:hypothetical protein
MLFLGKRLLFQQTNLENVGLFFLDVNLTNVLENVCQIIDITKLNKNFKKFKNKNKK